MKKVLKQTLSVLLAVIMLIITAAPAFAEENSAPEAQTEQKTEYTGSNSLGQVVSDAINESDAIQTEDETIEDNYYIQDVTVIENYYASVIVSAPDNTSLVVAVYDEITGEMVASAKTDVSSETDVAEVVFEDGISCEFFTVKAFLVDAENNPVCKNFETKKYTQAFQEYLSKTTEDFDEDKVINLDASKNNNFAVVSDNAEVISQSEEENILITNDFENGIYIFENANEEITSLKAGDIIYYVYGEGEEDYILDKIGTIENDNGTVTITSTDDFKMSDLFKYIRIDTEMVQTDVPETYAMTRSGNDESGDLDETVKTFVAGFNLEFDVGASEKVKFSGDMTVETTLQYYYDFELLGEDYYEVTCKIETKLEGKVEIEIGKKHEFNPEPIFKGKIPIVAGLDLVFTLEMKVEFEGKLTVDGSFEYCSTTGCKKITDKPKEDLSKKGEFILKANIEGEAAFRIIPAISAGIEIFKVIDISLEFNVTFEISAKVHVGIESGTDILKPDSLHNCTRCVDGDIILSANIEFKIEVGFDWAKVTLAEIKNELLHEKLCDFYVRFNSTNLITGFGLTECPNYRYKATFKVVDNKNNPIPNVMISDGTTKYTTDSNGEAIGYYKNGTHSVVAVSGNYSIDTSKMKSSPIKFGVYSQPNTVNIYMIKNLVGDENGIADAGIAGNNISWTLSADGTLNITGTGKMTDWYIEEKHMYNTPPWYEYASQIKKVNIASGITSIGGGAFLECVNLTQVNIPDNVNYIGDAAFASCQSLETVKLPSKLAVISDALFSYCLKLKNVTIPSGVTQIGMSAFGECTALEKITIPDKVTKIDIAAFGMCSSLTEVKIGNSVKRIEEMAFIECVELREIIIPDSVTFIGEEAFSACIKLKNVTIGSGVKSIGEYAFSTCAIENLVIKNGVESIGNYAFFAGCPKVKRLEIPGSVKKIGVAAFYMIGFDTENGIYTPVQIIINNGVTSIGDGAFYGCTKNINIPKTVVSIGEDAFFSPFLENITVDSANQLFSSDGNGVLYNKNKTTLIQYPNGNSRAQFEIPNTVTRIKANAFNGLLYLSSLVVPTSVKTIDADAFGDFTDSSEFANINTVYYKGTQKQWNAINIGTNNESLTTANIVYNYTSTAAASVMSLRSFSPLTADEELTITSIDDAIEGNEYIIAVVRVADAYDLLAEYNLLYIDQQTATDKNLTFEFILNENETEYEVVVLGERLPHEHNYMGAVTKEPTCTDVGIKTFICVCGDSYTEDIEMLDHEYETVVTAPTCTEQGFTIYTCECGDTYVADYVNETGHCHTSEITTPATHLKEGVMTFTCECGDTYTEPVAKLPDHTYETVITAPTCTEQGFTTYTCECGDSYIDDYVDEKGHTDEVIPGYEATCTETGLTDGVKCGVCGEELTAQEEIPALEHIDEDGDYICDNDCGYEFEKPAEPDTPDEPSADVCEDCGKVHTNFFSEIICFFTRIINFIKNLFA